MVDHVSCPPPLLSQQPLSTSGPPRGALSKSVINVVSGVLVSLFSRRGAVNLVHGALMRSGNQYDIISGLMDDLDRTRMEVRCPGFGLIPGHLNGHLRGSTSIQLYRVWCRHGRYIPVVEAPSGLNR